MVMKFCHRSNSNYQNELTPFISVSNDGLEKNVVTIQISLLHLEVAAIEHWAKSSIDFA